MIGFMINLISVTAKIYSLLFNVFFKKSRNSDIEEKAKENARTVNLKVIDISN